MKMPFGKYKGLPIEELPSSYLRWLTNNIDDEERGENSIQLNADEEYEFRSKYNTHFDD
jgi:hypothetical protein